jgi:hypothetical protein
MRTKDAGCGMLVAGKNKPNETLPPASRILNPE